MQTLLRIHKHIENADRPEENGSFRSTRTSFCGLTQMVPINPILDALDRLKNTVDAETAIE